MLKHWPCKLAICVSALTLPALAPRPGSAGDAETAAAAGTVSLAVSPAVVQWDLQRGRRNAHAIRLANLSEEALQVVAELRGWRLDEAGGVEDFEPEPGTFAAQVKAVPQRVSLVPNGHRTVRLWLEDGAALDDGEHRALLLLRGSDPSGDERIRLDLAVYAQLGEVRFDVTMESARWRLCDGSLATTFNVVNRGNRHLRMVGWLRVTGADGIVQRFPLPRSPVLPGETRSLISSQAWSGPMPTEVAMEGNLGPVVLDGMVVEARADGPCAEHATPLDSADVSNTSQRQRTP